MIGECLLVTLLVHRHSYDSEPLYGIGNHSFNNSNGDSMICEYVPYEENGCVCKYLHRYCR